jgi:lambda repressor-like predicted transcriptional regulator
MDTIEIIYRLHRLGKSQAQIARDLAISGGVVNNVIHGRITAHAVASHIAAMLGQTVEELWPARYTFKPRKSVCNQHISLDDNNDKEANMT